MPNMRKLEYKYRGTVRPIGELEGFVCALEKELKGEAEKNINKYVLIVSHVCGPTAFDFNFVF